MIRCLGIKANTENGIKGADNEKDGKKKNEVMGMSTASYFVDFFILAGAFCNKKISTLVSLSQDELIHKLNDLLDHHPLL